MDLVQLQPQFVDALHRDPGQYPDVKGKKAGLA